ncbi:hypothetical protein HDU76_001458, partial [Blyttiomyces sp. JEL0837]
MTRKRKIYEDQLLTTKFMRSGEYPDEWCRYPNIYGFNKTNGSIKNVNYYELLELDVLNSNPGASFLTIDHPCVYWFGESYPENSPIYERNAHLKGFEKIDSTYSPPPDQGWVYQLSRSTPPLDDIALFDFTIYQTRPWFVVGAKPDLIPILGQNPPKPLLNMTDGMKEAAKYQNQSFPTFRKAPISPRVNDSFGLLGTMEERFYANFSVPTTGPIAFTFNGFERVPFYVYDGINTGNDMDTVLRMHLESVISSLATIDKSVLDSNSATTLDYAIFILKASEYVNAMPYGALYLDQFNSTKLSSNIFLQIGTDKRIESAAGYPSKGFRLLLQIAQMNQALLRGFNPDLFEKVTITQGVRIFPEVKSTDLKLTFGGLIGRVLYPFGVSFLLPVFVVGLVKEKEARIMIMMTMNGMKSWAYYTSQYVTFYILYAISTFIFVLTGHLFNLELFTKTDLSVIVLVFFVWGHVQIILAFAFAALFKQSRLALVCVFLIVLCGVIVSFATEGQFKTTNSPDTLLFWPPFAFYRALAVMNTASYTKSLMPYKASMLKQGDRVYNAVIALVAEIFAYGILAIYLTAVGPTDFGVSYPWYFPITFPISYLRRKFSRRVKENELRRVSPSNGDDTKPESNVGVSMGTLSGLWSPTTSTSTPSKVLEKKISTSSIPTVTQIKVISQNQSQITIVQPGIPYEDSDVQAERNRIDQGLYNPSEHPVIIKHLHKKYGSRGGGRKGDKIAVKDVTFAVERGIVFGLLGPNGAGKTSLISMLTGLQGVTGGRAFLDGFEVGREVDEIFGIIGICPQFDILWDDLTVGEHLYFYARLKGIPPHEEKSAVDNAMRRVSMLTLENRISKRLSGGEKRRLSIAIALIGDPVVVFLDEPTTGLDPEVRRLIWNIIQDAKEDKTIILTTHSMEEAESLCQRIGIMSKGSLRCLGNPLRLKEVYGSGFRVFFNSVEDKTLEASLWVESVLPEGWRKIDAFATNTSYEFPATVGALSRLFEIIEREKGQRGIVDWGVSQTTLE